MCCHGRGPQPYEFFRKVLFSLLLRTFGNYAERLGDGKPF
jgi:hypothetical protein